MTVKINLSHPAALKALDYYRDNYPTEYSSNESVDFGEKLLDCKFSLYRRAGVDKLNLILKDKNHLTIFLLKWA
jgi:hypothetical protein